MTEVFGTEMWCGDEVISGRYASGTTAVLLALYGRLITPRGTLQGLDDLADGTPQDDGDELNYGFDVAGYIGAVGVDVAKTVLPIQIANECRKDDRVADVSVEITDSVADDRVGTSLAITVRATLVDDTVGSLELTVDVDNLETSLIGATS